MSFDYAAPVPAYQNTTTYGSKPLLVKSSLINIAAGAGGATATDYPVGIVLPRGAQIMLVGIQTSTPVSGGTISAATLAIKSGSVLLLSGQTVFAGSTVLSLNSTVPPSWNTLDNADQPLTYNLTLTGTGPATAGMFWVTVYYVM